MKQDKIIKPFNNQSIWNQEYGLKGNALGYIIWELNNKIEIKMNLILKDCGLTRFQFFVLMGMSVASENNMSLTQDQLSKFIHSNPMMVSKVIRKMEQEELLIRTENSKDSRAKLVRITSKGILKYNQAKTKIQLVSGKINTQIVGDKKDFVLSLENLINTISKL